MRCNSGDKGTASLGWLRLPFGRPGSRLTAGSGFFLAAVFAFLRACSSGRCTTCSSRNGKARRVVVLTTARLKKARPAPLFAAPPEKAVEAMHVLAGFGHHHFIASQDIAVVGLEEMVAKEEPAHLRPGNSGGEEALHGAIATAGFTQPS
jgi:hypothetical protein